MPNLRISTTAPGSDRSIGNEITALTEMAESASPLEPAAPAPPHVGPPPPRADYLLAGSMGAELSGPLLEMEQIIQQLLQTGKMSRPQISSLLLSLSTARRIATQAQMLDRLNHNPIRQSHERVQLDARLRQALAENDNLLQSRAVEIKQRLHPIEVVLDPGLLETLLNAALSWMARPGFRLLLTLESQPLTLHGLLNFKARPTVSAGFTPNAHQTEPYRLSWYLLNEAASRLQIPIRYNDTGTQLQLTLEFTRTQHQLERLTQQELVESGDSWSSSHSRSAGTPRVLLVSSDPALALDIEGICSDLHTLLQVAHSVEQSLKYGSTEAPDVLIVDLRLGENACQSLHEHFAEQSPALPYLEIADEQHSLAMASWSLNPHKRISLVQVRAQLPQVLVQELGKRN